LALVGLFLGVLAPSLPPAASPVAREAISLLRAIVFGSGASPVLSLAEERPLTPAAHLTSPPDDRSTLDDYDLDDDESSTMPLLTLGAQFLPPAPVGRGVNDSSHACMWPAHYFVRPQLLTRL
jgi:hypothetical protein